MTSTTAVLGIPAIDRELANDLPPGWLGLLIGGSGSATALAAKQYAQAERGGEPVLYYTTHEREEDIRAAVAGFGWSFDGVRIVSIADEYFERVLRRDLEVSRLRERGITLKELTDRANAPARRRSHNLTNRLLADLAALERPFRLVVDSLDFFLEVLDPTESMTMVRQIRHRVQELGGQVLLVVQADAHDGRTVGLLEDLADLVVELRAEERDVNYEQVIAIRKVRNHPERTMIRVATTTQRGLDVPTPPATPDVPGKPIL